MTTTTWTVTSMNCYSQLDANTDVVFMVHWMCSGVDENQGFFIYATSSLPVPSDTFTPYADLTQDQVLGWIWDSGVNKTAIETAVEQHIQNRTSPPRTTPSLPWVDTSELNNETNAGNPNL